MSSLLRLYPQAWRERYGDELLALLQDRPASLTDYLDLIRGALDARLHPQVRGAATPDKESSMNQRVLALSAAAGGVVLDGRLRRLADLAARRRRAITARPWRSRWWPSASRSWASASASSARDRAMTGARSSGI